MFKIFILIFAAAAILYIEARSLVSSIASLKLPASGNETGIVFFKTHKTGGSTLTSVLWRQVCVVEGRNCFLPAFNHPGKTYDFDEEKDIRIASSATGSAGRRPPFDAWLNHAYYHPFVPDSLVIQPNIVLSIIREPAMRFRSAWEWYGLSALLHEPDMDAYIKKLYNMSVTERTSLMKVHARSVKFHSYLNSYSAELTHERPTNLMFHVAFSKLIAKVQNGEIFLLICDRYDESLLILRRLMGWASMSSILYIPMKQNKNHTGVAIVGETHHELVALQHWDQRLFVEANATLNKYIEIYGKTEFESDLLVLTKATDDVYIHCVENKSNGAFVFNGTSISCEELGRDNRDHVQETAAAVAARRAREANKEAGEVTMAEDSSFFAAVAAATSAARYKTRGARRGEE